jgi:hypothetical protein
MHTGGGLAEALAMGRIRSIKPDLLEDERAGKFDDLTWRLWVSSWLLADDYGDLRGDVGWLSCQVFWGREISEKLIKEVSKSVKALIDAGMLRKYSVRGQTYMAISNWKKHQKVDHPGNPHVPRESEADSEIPRNDSREPRENLATDQDQDQDQDQDHSLSIRDARPDVREDSFSDMNNKIRSVWAHWLTKKPGTRRKELCSKDAEHATIKRALGVYSPEDLIKAIDGMFSDEWSVANCCDLGWALRRDSKRNNIEKFIALLENPPKPVQKKELRDMSLEELKALPGFGVEWGRDEHGRKFQLDGWRPKKEAGAGVPR